MGLRDGLNRNSPGLIVLEGILAMVGFVVLAAAAQTAMRGFFPRATASSLGWALGLTLAALLGAILAFRHWRRSRAIVDTPTSPIGAIAIGNVELQGRVQAIPDVPLERSRFDGRACVALEYRKTVGSGKHARVVERVNFCAPFLLADDTGAVRVDLTGFDLGVKEVQRTMGNAREEEIALAPGDTLYVMGACELQDATLVATDDRLANLVVRKAARGAPSLAGTTERAVLTRARRRMALYGALAAVLLLIAVPRFFDADAFERAYATGALYELEKANVTLQVEREGWGSPACPAGSTGCFGALARITNANPQHNTTYEPSAFTLSYSYPSHDSKGRPRTEYASSRALVARVVAEANGTARVELAFQPHSGSSVRELDYAQPWIDAPLETSPR